MRLGLALLFSLSSELAGCAAEEPESELDLATAKLSGISNLDAPSTIVVGLNKGTVGSTESKTIAQLFDVVVALNKTRGTQPPVELVVTIPERFEGSDFEEPGPVGEPLAIWKRDFVPALTRSYGADAVASALKTHATSRSNYWLQDYYEVLTATTGSRTGLARIDLLQPENTGSTLGKWFDGKGVKGLSSPFSRGAQTSSSAHGGNIESMPNGRLYIGAINPYSTIDVAVFGLDGEYSSAELDRVASVTASWGKQYDANPSFRVTKQVIDSALQGLPESLPEMIKEAVDAAHVELAQAEQLQSYLAKRTGVAPVRVDTSWLALGHVDEALSYVPANNACGYALLWGDPLEGMALEMTAGGALADGMQPKFLSSFIQRAYLDSPGGAALSAAIRANRAPTLADLEAALDFLEGNAFAKPILEGLTQDPDRGARNRVLLHLQGGRAQRKTVKALASAQGCAAPAVALPTAYTVGQSDTQLRGLFDSVGRLNLVVLRDHVLVRHEQSESLRQSADFKESARRLLQLVPRAKIHEIDVPSNYQGGAIHCATQVLRQPTRR